MTKPPNTKSTTTSTKSNKTKKIRSYDIIAKLIDKIDEPLMLFTALLLVIIFVLGIPTLTYAPESYKLLVYIIWFAMLILMFFIVRHYLKKNKNTKLPLNAETPPPNQPPNDIPNVTATPPERPTSPPISPDEVDKLILDIERASNSEEFTSLNQRKTEIENAAKSLADQAKTEGPSDLGKRLMGLLFDLTDRTTETLILFNDLNFLANLRKQAYEVAFDLGNEGKKVEWACKVARVAYRAGNRTAVREWLDKASEKQRYGDDKYKKLLSILDNLVGSPRSESGIPYNRLVAARKEALNFYVDNSVEDIIDRIIILQDLGAIEDNQNERDSSQKALSYYDLATKVAGEKQARRPVIAVFLAKAYEDLGRVERESIQHESIQRESIESIEGLDKAKTRFEQELKLANFVGVEPISSTLKADAYYQLYLTYSTYKEIRLKEAYFYCKKSIEFDLNILGTNAISLEKFGKKLKILFELDEKLIDCNIQGNKIS
jgi:tetratricopeptide (TPR) repeat protein